MIYFLIAKGRKFSEAISQVAQNYQKFLGKKKSIEIEINKHKNRHYLFAVQIADCRAKDR